MSFRMFRWKGLGSRVQIIGPFTNWCPIDMFKTPGSDTWILNVPDPGYKAEYRFLIDGKTHHDTKLNSKLIKTEDTPPPKKSQVRNEPLVIDTEDKSIEVERKFSVPSNYESLLKKEGFKPVKDFENEELNDSYYDTENFSLMKKDFWLRSRNGEWELKYPVDFHPTGSTIYHESSDSEDIFNRVFPLLNESASNGPHHIQTNLGDLICNRTLKKFADFETKRKYYSKDHVGIVIDSTNWGYAIGEIEIMVSDKSKVLEASEEIETIAKSLNLVNCEISKLDDYLSNFNEEVYMKKKSLKK